MTSRIRIRINVMRIRNTEMDILLYCSQCTAHRYLKDERPLMAGGRGYDGINGLDDPVKSGVSALKEKLLCNYCTYKQGNKYKHCCKIFDLRYKIKTIAKELRCIEENRKAMGRI
jgi:hypothetical protein